MEWERCRNLNLFKKVKCKAKPTNECCITFCCCLFFVFEWLSSLKVPFHKFATLFRFVFSHKVFRCKHDKPGKEATIPFKYLFKYLFKYCAADAEEEYKVLTGSPVYHQLQPATGLVMLLCVSQFTIKQFC